MLTLPFSYRISGNKDLTQLLNKAQTGDKLLLDKLLPLVYNEMRRIAENQLRNERGDTVRNDDSGLRFA